MQKNHMPTVRRLLILALALGLLPATTGCQAVGYATWAAAAAGPTKRHHTPDPTESTSASAETPASAQP